MLRRIALIRKKRPPRIGLRKSWLQIAWGLEGILSLFGKSSNEILNFLIIIPIIGQMLHFYLDSQLWKFSKEHNRANTLKFIKTN